MELYNEFEHQKEIEEIENIERDNFVRGIKLANKHGWGLTNFKRFISSFLKTKNNEDQWTFDYESYCYCLSILKEEKYEWIHPKEWAEEYYNERWDFDKYKKGIEELGKIARGEIIITNPTPKH